MFPKFDGWVLNVGETVYTPDNLWDIINGAADSYLSYDFKRLYTAEYFDEQDRRIKVYIYKHSNPTNTFGIYSQERSSDYEFNETGAQGFNSGEVYYFITGSYYVQLSTSDKGLNESLKNLAELIDDKLGGNDTLPKKLSLFPEKGKVPNSEKYIANGFMGYGFLHSAFTADYKQDGESFMVFIISPEDEHEAQKILYKYLDYLEFPKDKRDSNKYIVEDPYNGTVLLYTTGKYLCGIVGTEGKTMDTFFTLFESKMQ
ncbi:MAG: DUF6599 family protein [Bacteroidales bacterium]